MPTAVMVARDAVLTDKVVDSDEGTDGPVPD